MPKTQENDEIDKILERLYRIAATTEPHNDLNVFKFNGVAQAREAIQRLIAEAEQRGVAWTISQIDDMHLNTPQKDTFIGSSLFKGIKSSLRNRYELHTGIDPAPNYPIKVNLRASPNTKQENE